MLPVDPDENARSMLHRNAASVFPEPVGAHNRTWPPDAIAGHACDWAAVGTAKFATNQLRVASEKQSREISARYRGAATLWPAPLRSPAPARGHRAPSPVATGSGSAQFDDGVRHLRQIDRRVVEASQVAVGAILAGGIDEPSVETPEHRLS